MLKFPSDEVRDQFDKLYDVKGVEKEPYFCQPKENAVTVDEKGVETHEIITIPAANLMLMEMQQAVNQKKLEVQKALASVTAKQTLSMAEAIKQK